MKIDNAIHNTLNSVAFRQDFEIALAEVPHSGLCKEILSEVCQFWKEQIPQRHDYKNLQVLGEVLSKVRQFWKEQAEKAIQSMDKEDPLLCPISLFGTMQHGRLEVAHTRTLAWLLNPNEKHGFGMSLLQGMLNFLREKVPENCYLDQSEIKVTAEYIATTESRLDIFIQGSYKELGTNTVKAQLLIVVEAKIDASEGEEQLSKYENQINSYEIYLKDFIQASQYNCHTYRIFLTPDKREPETAEDDWLCVSFAEIARVLWHSARQNKDVPGYHFLRYYLAGVLHDIAGCPPIESQEIVNPFALVSYLNLFDTKEQ